jgi:hypothetical protein
MDDDGLMMDGLAIMINVCALMMDGLAIMINV